MKNHLIPEILSLLHQHPGGISEYSIIKSLEENAAFDSTSSDEYDLILFQKHFMVMNALHQLQSRLWEDEQLRLEISPLNIQLHCSEQFDDTQISEPNNEKLSSYYLDWSNLENTDASDVERLLENFWELFINTDKRADALNILELEVSASEKAINTRYRELAAIHHPDKGGDTATFIRIRKAYEILNPKS